MAKDGRDKERSNPDFDVPGILNDLDLGYRQVIERRIASQRLSWVSQSGSESEEAQADRAITEIFRFGNMLDQLTGHPRNQQVDPVHSPGYNGICADETYAGYENIISILDGISKFRLAIGSTLGRFRAQLFG